MRGWIAGFGSTLLLAASASAGTELAPPGDVRMTGQERAVFVFWSPVTGAAGYRVHVSDRREGPYVPSNENPIRGTNRFLDGLDDSAEVWVFVTAVDAGGADGPPSLPVVARTRSARREPASRTSVDRDEAPDPVDVPPGRWDPFHFGKRFFVGGGVMLLGRERIDVRGVSAEGGLFSGVRIGFAKESGFVGYHFQGFVAQGQFADGTRNQQPIGYGAISQDIHAIIVYAGGTLISAGIPIHTWVTEGDGAISTGVSFRYRKWSGTKTAFELRVAPHLLYLDGRSDAAGRFGLEADVAYLRRINPKISIAVGADLFVKTMRQSQTTWNCNPWPCVTTRRSERLDHAAVTPHVQMILHLGRLPLPSDGS